MRAADLAMYGAKRAGGDRFTGPVVVTSSAQADPLLGTSVSAVAGRGEFLMHFQPIVALDDGRVVSVEALVRWQHPELGLLHPGDFLPAVERGGQLADFDAWVVHAACQQFAAWQRTRSTSPGLNVNISAAGLLSQGIVDRVLDAVAAARLDPAVLRIEVSKDLLAEHIDAVTPVLQQLAASGVAVRFDDAGAGSVWLRHLRTVAADGLKIDRSYIAGMLEGPRDGAVVQLLIDFALGTGARITAEGIETEEQRQMLHSTGCLYGQGWLFTRAAPLSDLGADLPRTPRTSCHLAVDAAERSRSHPEAALTSDLGSGRHPGVVNCCWAVSFCPAPGDRWRFTSHAEADAVRDSHLQEDLMTAAAKNDASTSASAGSNKAERAGAEPNRAPAARFPDTLEELARAQEDLTEDLHRLVTRQALDNGPVDADHSRERAGRMVAVARAELLGQLREQEQEQARRQLAAATRSSEDAAAGVVRGVTPIVRTVLPAALLRPDDLIEATYMLADQGLRVSRRLALAVSSSVRELTASL